MKSKILYILLIISTLVSCGGDNWFYHEVEYNGKEEQAKLCLMAEIHAGETMRVSVLRSYFFQDPNRFVSDKEEYWYRELKRGYLHHANVRLCVNEEDWFSLHCVENGGTIDEMHECYYTCEYIPKAGDKLRFEASADGLQSVYAEQVVPYPLNVRIQNFDTVSVPGMAYFTMQFPSTYDGDMTDFVRITSAMSYQKTVLNSIRRWDSETQTYYEDWDESREVRMMDEIYAQGVAFSRCATNVQMTKGFYGSDRIGLYARVEDVLGQSIVMAIPCCPGSISSTRTDYNITETAELVLASLRVETTQRDGYLLISSQLKKDFVSVIVPNYIATPPHYVYTSTMEEEDENSDIDIDFDFSEIGELMEELMADLGLQENVQLYSNIWNEDETPAIGHVVAYSQAWKKNIRKQ